MGRCNVNRNQNCFQCCRSPRRLHNNYFEWVNQHWQRTLWNVVSVQELFFTSHSLLCTTVGVTRPLVHFTHTHTHTHTHPDCDEAAGGDGSYDHSDNILFPSSSSPLPSSSPSFGLSLSARTGRNLVSCKLNQKEN